MKKLAIFLLPLFLFACASKKEGFVVGNGTPVIQSNCPPEGTCAITVHKDKSLLVTKDDMGKLYYELADNPSKVVISYAYNKTKNPDYQDDFYNEEIIFESDAQLSNLEAGVKPEIFFTVNCFCRDRQGTYKVDNGNINFKNGLLSIGLPQIINNQLTNQVTVLFK